MKMIEFKDFNLAIKLTNLINVIGRPSSGKTNLLKMLINQLYNPNIYIDGKRIDEYSLDYKRKNIAAAMHNFNFNTEYVNEELLYYQDIVEIDKNISFKQIANFVKYFSLEEIIETKIEYLKRSEKALLKILSLLIIKPKLLGIDTLLEYLSNEDKLKIIKYAKENKISILNVTSDPEELLLGTHIIVVNNFKVESYETTKRTLKNEKLLLSAGFDLPFIVSLSNGLNSYELIKKTFYEKEGLVEELWK